MTDDSRSRRAASFGSAAEAYERGRPGYPERVVDWLVPDGARCVVDIGAGTGKLTRQLLGRAERVIAVEPSTGMLDVLRARVPGAAAVEGSAEAVPLGEGNADAVLFAQSWHWADPVAASSEAARLLRRGGTLGLVWNFRDARVPWVAALDAILEEGSTEATVGRPRPGGRFGRVERLEHEWTDVLPRDAVVDMVLSRSFMITADEGRRRRVLAELDTLLDGHGDTVLVPYTTVAYRARRTDRP
ncbi:class I SAM-dependent methyltransferase [Mycetocola reblochoni]|uniref:Methyltransferase n=2 Tax=Mycetocola reblochoni TaxID=331618 RepID=A0A1R4IXV5_9MICO|nr:class I SAM-dependent methyltransferase [Mycetocola reblochoni]RLP70920.1 class I SAM-dependent methyltransferase [Mycetocola reblochoni]SJN24524.1 Methyltransferase [Mycetocola reblochoni REB411]